MEQNLTRTEPISKQDDEVIDLREVFKTLWRKKWTFFVVWLVSFALACAYILPQPRIYSASVSLAPEAGGQSSGGTLSSLASSFGFDIGSGQTEDAFYPELYPDLMSTNDFLVDLLYVPVKTQDAGIDTTYLTYLTKHQLQNPYSAPFRWCKRKLRNFFGDKPAPVSLDKRINPRQLSREEDALVSKVRESVTCDVDIKTNVITITVVDQDPLVCVTIADSTCARLQELITEYRTSKARTDLDYYQQLAENAEREYKEAVNAYSAYCDSHQNVILQLYVSERDELENVMSTKLTTFNAMQTQYQAAKAKVQERTPAFTILKPASVPVKPEKPKRMMFVFTIVFLSTLATCFWIFRKSIVSQLLGPTSSHNNECADEQQEEIEG